MTGALAQLALDDFLKLGKAEGAFVEPAIDDETRRAIDAKEARTFDVLHDRTPRLLGIQTSSKLLHAQPETRRNLLK